jgi:hypothetical protein
VAQESRLNANGNNYLLCHPNGGQMYAGLEAIYQVNSDSFTIYVGVSGLCTL